ncbi:MAG: 3-deoxy-D-manno-octulosonic acid transferase [Verrucomicrobiota bacterium]
MIWIYRLLFPVVMLLASPHYLLRMRKRGGYGADFGQRFGRVPALPAKRAGVRRIWLQAVSVGELLAVGPLIEAWHEDPEVEVYLTTTTSTGRALAEERYRGKVIGIGYFPLDVWPCARRAWKVVRADLAVLTEGERWPEHVRQAARRGVPVVAINARMSDRSFRRMRPFAGLSRVLLGGTTRILAASEGDAERFRALGFPAGGIEVTGNIKLDLELSFLDATERAALRASLGVGDEPVILGASTWAGEEAALIVAFQRARMAGLCCRLVLVPRHAERRGEIEPLLVASGLSHHVRSRGAAPGPVDIVLADTTGELRRLLQLASVVFVGKTLPPHTEGQTPVEAAALGRAVLLGPGTGNFRKIVDELLACGAARRVDDADALAAEVRALLTDEEARVTMGDAGIAWHRANTGALLRTLRAISGLLQAMGK